MFRWHSKKRLWKVTLSLLLPLVGLIASGCPKNRLVNPVLYRAGFVINPNNNIHLLYFNDYDNVAYHMERKNGQWQKEEIVRRKDHLMEESFFSSEGELCVYAGSLRYCKGSDGVWRSNERSLWWSYDARRGHLLADHRHRLAIVSHYSAGVPFTASFFEQYKENKFFMGDEETGEKTPYLTSLPMTLFMPYVQNIQSGFKYSGGGLPFYDQGVWDGARFIYQIEGHVSGGPFLSSFFLVSHSQEGWKVEKIGGEVESTEYPPLLLNYLSFKGQRITAFDRSHIIKNDGNGDGNGKVIMEPFPPAYVKIFSNRSNGHTYSSSTGAFYNRIDIVDMEGKVHAFMNESQGKDAFFKPRIYYHVYNPNAVSPEIPEIRELIDAQG